MATVNENPQDKLIRLLKEENEHLKRMIAEGGKGAVDGKLSIEVRYRNHFNIHRSVFVRRKRI